MEGAEDAIHDIGDEGIITASRAITKDWNRFARFDQAGEFIDRQVGALTWAVDRKEAQAEDADAIEVTVNMA